MPGDSRDYYHSSKASGGSRRTNRTHDDRDHDEGYDERHLPSIRDVVGEQLDTPVPHHPAYNLSGMDRALPDVGRGNYSSQPGPRLPPINRYESTSQNRQDGREHRSHHHSIPPDSLRESSRQPASQGSYHVFAQSNTRGELITVSTSSRPHGIMRDRDVAVGSQPSPEDTRRRFECHVCGRRMERQSVYNQHMITHTDERPHICEICKKSFNSKSNLNRHLQTHGTRSTHYEDVTEDHGGASSSKDYYSSSRRK